MEKISINLLPPEFTAQEVKKSKFYKVQAISISVILVLIFLSVLTVSLRIFQSNRIKIAQLEVAEAENRVTSQSLKQAQLLLLKNRLKAIQNYSGVPSIQAGMYTLVNGLFPPLLKVSSISVGREGVIVISALAPDVNILDVVFNDLLNKEKNENKISKVSIESLNRGRDGLYRVNFTVGPKK